MRVVIIAKTVSIRFSWCDYFVFISGTLKMLWLKEMVMLGRDVPGQIATEYWDAAV